MRLVLPFLVLATTMLVVHPVKAATCDLCFDGEPITRPEYVLDLIDPIPIKTCGDLTGLLLFVDENDEACTAARAASSLCGCPNVPPDACTICGSNKMAKPLQNLDGLVDLGDLDFLGLTPTCALVDSGINVFDKRSGACLALPVADLQLYCGCLSVEEEDSASDVCTLCPGGEIVPSLAGYEFIELELSSDITPGGYPNRILCKDAETMVRGEQRESILCKDVQRGSTACGCPVPDSACQLCPNGGEPLLKTERVESIFGPGLLCSSLVHQLHQFDGNSTECQTLGNSYADTCGCEKEVEIVPCTLCPGGEPVAYPDKFIAGVEGLGFDHIEHTCGTFEQLAVLLDEKDSTCSSVRALAKACGCPVPENSCSICQDGASFNNPLGEYVWTYGSISPFSDGTTEGIDFNNRKFRCEFADSFMSATLDADDSDCYWNQLMRGTSCGCSGSINSKVKGLMWTQRCSGILSLIGSLAIIFSVLAKEAKDRWNTYNQLVLSISVFDSLSSIAFIFGSALTPAQLGLYGSIGNEATCSFQGWLFQVGIISVYYSVVLCIYFILIVKYSWTERKFKKVRKWVHWGVLTIGITMSLAVIPFVNLDWRLCYVPKPPILNSWLPSIFFFLLPVGGCMVGMTLLMAFFVKFVREVENKSKASRFSDHQFHKNDSSRPSKGENVPNRRSLTTRTFWQSAYFLAVFYAVWPIQFISFLVPVVEHNSWVYFLAALLGPLQGFLNAIVFFCRDGKSLRRGLQSRFGGSTKGSTFFLRAPKESRSHSSLIKWNYSWAGKRESSSGLYTSNELSQVSPYPAECCDHGDRMEQLSQQPGGTTSSADPPLRAASECCFSHKQDVSERAEQVAHQMDRTSNETNIDPLRSFPCDGDEGLFADAKTSEGPLKGDEKFEGEAILEYARNAGLLDESECKRFDKSVSGIEAS